MRIYVLIDDPSRPATETSTSYPEAEFGYCGECGERLYECANCLIPYCDNESCVTFRSVNDQYGLVFCCKRCMEHYKEDERKIKQMSQKRKATSCQQ